MVILYFLYKLPVLCPAGIQVNLPVTSAAWDRYRYYRYRTGMPPMMLEKMTNQELTVNATLHGYIFHDNSTVHRYNNELVMPTEGVGNM